MMKKLWLFAFVFAIIFSAFGASFVPKVFASTKSDEMNFRAYGDSISAGYGLDDYENYCPPKKSNKPKTSFLTKDCFTDVISKPYLEYFDGSAIGYGIDGYTSSDLVGVLQPYQSGVANDYQDFLNTDVFTLSIGANNILHIAAANFQKYIDGTITDGEYRKLLLDSVEVFKEDYETVIIPTLTMNNAYVLVMTLYNPYKFTSAKDITVDTGDEIKNAGIRTVLSAIDVTLQEFLSVTMYYMQQINDIIKSSESERVYVADVWTMCEGLSKQKYIEYFNVDASKIVITDANQNVDMSMFLKHCDPHPEAAGHKAIAEEFIKQFKYFKLELKTDLSTINYNNQDLIFDIKTIQTENYTYKLIKNTENGLQEICTADTNSFSVKALNFDGNNKLFVQVYKDNALVFNSNAITFNLHVEPEPVLPESPQEPDCCPDNEKDDQMSTFEIITVCFMAFFGLTIIFLVAGRIKKRYKA